MFEKFVAAAGFVLFVAWLITAPTAHSQNDEPGHAKTWQHLALTTGGETGGQVARQINNLGNDGWELVDVETFAVDDEPPKTIYYFKKPG